MNWKNISHNRTMEVLLGSLLENKTVHLRDFLENNDPVFVCDNYLISSAFNVMKKWCLYR